MVLFAEEFELFAEQSQLCGEKLKVLTARASLFGEKL